jgi:glycosyltransferase involved in cell wall biosynthesis
MPRPRRIAVVTSSYPSHSGDAAGHFVATEAQLLAASGVQVLVIAPGSADLRVADALPPASGPGSLEVVRVSGGSAFGLPGVMARLRERPARSISGLVRFVRGARRELRRRGPFDGIVAHWIVPAGWPIAVGVPGELEVVVHGSDARLLISLPDPLRRAILGALLARGATFRFVSDELRRELLARGPEGLAARSIVRAAALELPPLPSRSEARAELGVSPETRLIVIVGRLIPEKRVAVAARAATLIPAARVVVIGDGPARSAVQAAAPTAELTGALPRPRALLWLRAADLLVSASRAEGAPSVVREARQLGVPVVAVAAGDLECWAERDADLSVVDPTRSGGPRRQE